MITKIQPTAPDLALVGTTKSELALQQSWSTGLSFVFGVVLVLILELLNLDVGPSLSFLVVVAFTTTGYWMPLSQLRKRACRKRSEFQICFAVYLELVNILLAGGAGVETALLAAASAGDGWVFDELTRVLDTSRATRQSPWILLNDFGERNGLVEASEIAASIQLAGEQGSKIRQSLSAKAVTLRMRQLAQAEAQAQVATEKMGIPSVMLFVAFVLLLGYPAMQSIMGTW